jgi:hypothetical protein
MDPEIILENYLSSHPFYWEFDNELFEVRRLKLLVKYKKMFNPYSKNAELKTIA